MAIDWDVLYELSPSDSTFVKDTDDAIRSFKQAVRERLTKEHEHDLASQSRQGLHRAGSALAFYQSSAPTQRNGVALAAADAGLLYVDSDDKLTKVWDGGSFEGLRAQSAIAADSATNATNATNAGTAVFASSNFITGGIGSYGLFRHGAGAITPGTDVDGSTLRYAGTSDSGLIVYPGLSPGGTWRCIGYSGTLVDTVTLYF